MQQEEIFLKSAERADGREYVEEAAVVTGITQLPQAPTISAQASRSFSSMPLPGFRRQPVLSFMQEDAMGLSEPMDSFRFKCHGLDPLKTRKGFENCVGKTKGYYLS